jgi:hypothetical protein
VRAAALAGAVALATVAGAIAGETSFGAFAVRAERPELIYLDGDIGYAAFNDFQRARRAAPDATTLILNSDGGSVDEAIRIARDVREAGLDTYVPLRQGCYSACAYIFFGGVNRRATGQLGVHQVSDPDFTPVSLQESLADLIDLFRELGVDALITSHMLRTPPEAMYVLDGRQVEELAVNADHERRLDALDDLFGHLPGKWVSDGGACHEIGSGIRYRGCVPAEWIPTAPIGSERYYFQDAAHEMGLLVIDDPDHWTRGELREVVLETAELEGDGDSAATVQEMKWPVPGLTVDLMVYPGRHNGAEVLYQHFYSALPDGGAIQVLVYSHASRAWQATSSATAILSQLEVAPAPEREPVTPLRDRKPGDRQWGLRPSGAGSDAVKSPGS